MSLMAELRRRNVFRVAMLYVVFSWLILQVADVVFGVAQVPDWSLTLLAILLALGLPPAVVFSWIYEMTPEGIKREKDIDRSQSITDQTARKINAAILLVMTVAVILLAARGFWPAAPNSDLDQPQAAAASSSLEPEPKAVEAPDTGPPIVAVLPLQALSTEDEGKFLASGLHDDLLTRLARLESFRVISRTSVMEYADTTKNMRQIGEELGAGYILEGGLQAIGGRVRINAQLIKASSDEHLWAETFDRELTTANLFDVQAEIATAIASAMRATLSPEEIARVAEVPTQSLEAYETFLAAIETSGDLSAPAMRSTMEAFRRATELDPGFADAWAGLSLAYSRLYWETGGERGGDVDATLRDKASAALERARTLAPKGVQTLRAAGYYHYYGFRDFTRALLIVGEAEALAPNDGTIIALRGFLLRRLGRFDEAADALVRTVQLDPRAVGYNREALTTLRYAGRCEEASALATRVLSLFPDNTGVLDEAAWVRLICDGQPELGRELMLRGEVTTTWDASSALDYLIRVGAHDDGLALLERLRPTFEADPATTLLLLNAEIILRRTTGDEEGAERVVATAGKLAAHPELKDSDSFIVLSYTARLAALRGEVERTVQLVERALERLPADQLTGPRSRYDLLVTLALAGSHERALQELEIVVDQVGVGYLGRPDRNPLLASLHGLQQFRDIVARLEPVR